MVRLATAPDELSTAAHDEKAKPLEAEAINCTSCPRENHVPDGFTATVPLPDGDTPVSSRYCVAKFAVYVVPLVGETVWDIAPPSLHSLQTYWTPVPPLWGELVATVWLEPETQLKI